ncbi:DUF6461 domain-containing protein [Allokutzneria albata]|uniref:Uncharacterized protein n=1 Tax=Allokutzneria albata TaxID=211114 RepID=A0A1G9U717_ALLAB|nr:DUF6461 domain-containing protein [Allokutzneria albata]SDM55678.1 hypothetical protein SAMN04489726_2226 [Allokutzneria albata]
MGDDLAWADASPGEGQVLDEIFCLTFVRGVDAAEALRRMGGMPDTVATRTSSDHWKLHNFDDGYPETALALPLGTWTVVFEPSGFNGSSLTPVVSRGTEVVSVLRHDYATPSFDYAVDGELITTFDPTFPAHRYGADPDRLLPRMLDVGFGITEDEEDDGFDNFDGAFGRSLRLIEQVTGVLPAFEALTGPLTSAYLEPWFTEAHRRPAGRPGHDGPVDALAEVRRLSSLHGLSDTPGLADALAAVERGEQVTATPDSPLGRHVRTWLTDSRRASWSLNDHSARHRINETERRRAFELGWLTVALGAAIRPDLVR